MGIFSNDARQFKFDILLEIAKEAFNNELSEENINAYARKLSPGNRANYRCCVYKEREILRQRARLAMGKMAADNRPMNPRQVIQVIDAACDGCTIKKVQITNNCRKCMAKSCLSSCNFGAISMGAHRAEIDHTKCKECGLCAKNCPYNAIVITERPCSSHCPVDAITWNEDGIAYIQEEKCINCGQCLAACPFGAIEDMSYIVPVIEALVGKDQKTACIVAPSIQGQFENTTLKQIFAGLRKLGFDQIYEAALGADIVATEEHEELKEHMEAGIPLTTSCCPAFVTMAKKHFPEVYEKNVSSTVSPMIAMARIVKADQPKTKLVFIGPCMAKKQEALEEFSPVDYVLTFEELAALFIAKNIRCSELEEDTFEDASVFGRNFAMGGGVSKAVVQAADEKGDKAFKAVYADGCFDCKKQLMLLKIGKFNADILEGMSCQGGCINGPGTIENPVKAKVRMTKENADIKKDILPSAKGAEYPGINMHRGK